MKILMGADPEVFVRKNGVLTCAHGLVPGTKADPYPVKRGAVQVDGMALEFNIDPASSRVEFTRSIRTVLSELRKMVPDYDLEIASSVEFSGAVMDAAPEEAKVLGCDPDYNAYTEEINPAPNPDQHLRTAAGHVHIGWTKDQDPFEMAHYQSCIQLTKQLDAFLGLPACLIDQDHRRRRLYGMAGAFRPKPYGCEYRVLSNWWLKSPQYSDWVYSNTKLAIKTLLEGNYLFPPERGYPGRIDIYINHEYATSIINSALNMLEKIAGFKIPRPPKIEVK